MKNRILSLTAILMFFVSGLAFAGTVNLPQTGQKKCYDTSGIEIPCPGTGQDGDIQAGVAWPSPRFTDNGNGTMTDNLTGLMWTKNANIPDGAIDWYQAVDFCNNLALGGYTDWRLPNVNELESLVNANEADSAAWLTTQGFTNVQAYNYWSSTTCAFNTDYALIVFVWYGYVGGDDKSNYYAHDFYFYVWPVRSGQCGSFDNSVICLPKTGQTKCYNASGAETSCSGTGQDGDIQAGVAWPSPRFTDNGGGTVTDNLTGLMWTKNANLPNGDTNWQQALNYVAGMNAGTYPNFSYTDWRLPNQKELHSLIDYSQYDLALPSHPFTNVQAGYYWSSTTLAYYPVYAWSVYIYWGGMDGITKSYGFGCVWPVRGPVEPTLITLSSFTATPSDRSVILTWTTASEIDNAGFNIYRAETENGQYVKINSSLIPAQGSATSGATYNYVDNDVQNRKTYFYKLEDVDLNGVATLHGPVSVMPKKIQVKREK